MPLPWEAAAPLVGLAPMAGDVYKRQVRRSSHAFKCSSDANGSSRRTSRRNTS